MGKNSNLDLHLLSSISSPSPSPSPSSSSSCDESSLTTQQPYVNQQELAVLYEGRVRPFDLTEFQARAIIWLASREVQSSSPPLKKSQLWSPSASGLSMKRSLQRFLQERRKRARAMSPYIRH